MTASTERGPAGPTPALPPMFRVQAPDGALGGDLPPGRWVVCQTTTEPPGEKLPNGCIAVVRVDGGDTYLRRIKHVDGGWIAATDDSDFEGWKSWEHDLRVIAVAMHAETPLQPSTTAITRDACLDVSEPMNRFQAAPRRAPWKSA